jgi:hypothetical protein
VIGHLLFEFAKLLFELGDRLVETAPEVSGGVLGSEILFQFGENGNFNVGFVGSVEINHNVDIGNSIDETPQPDNFFSNLLTGFFRQASMTRFNLNIHISSPYAFYKGLSRGSNRRRARVERANDSGADNKPGRAGYADSTNRSDGKDALRCSASLSSLLS